MEHNHQSQTWPAHKGVPREISRHVLGHGKRHMTRSSAKTKKEIKKIHTRRSRHFLKRNIDND